MRRRRLQPFLRQGDVGNHGLHDQMFHFGAGVFEVQGAAPCGTARRTADTFTVGQISPDLIRKGLYSQTEQRVHRRDLQHKPGHLLADRRKAGKVLKDLEVLLESKWYSSREAADHRM